MNIYKKLGGAGKEWLFAEKILLDIQLLKLRESFGPKIPFGGGGYQFTVFIVCYRLKKIAPFKEL